MLDEPTTPTDSTQADSTNESTPPRPPDGPTSPDAAESAAGSAPEPAAKPRRRRATKATAPAAPSDAQPEPDAAVAAEPSPATAAQSEPDAAVAAEPSLVTAEPPAADAGDAPSAPAKRARKAPAKKAAPRKRATKAVAPPESADAPTQAESTAPPADDAGLSPQELRTEAALLDAGKPVVTPVEDDPSVALAVDDEAPAALLAPAAAPAESPAPVKRTRARRTAAVTFIAPEFSAPEFSAPEQASEHADPAGISPADEAAGDAAPAPRRRRRAGTSGAAAPSDLLPTLIEPPAANAADGQQEPEAADGSDDDSEGDDRPRRRRRGRRGRGGARPAEDDQGDDDQTGDDDSERAEPSATTTDQPVEQDGASETADEDDDEAGSGTTRRRRRRRRTGASGEDETEAPSQPAARTSRNRSGAKDAKDADDDGVRGIAGSTRMAAKRVRRQEGRDSGRKRPPLLSEAEFLARRESVERTMVVRQKGDRTQIAVLEDGVLVEHYVTRTSAQSYAGNVYLGRVQNVLPSMEAAFVDLGKSRNAVLYAGEVNYSDVAGGRSRSIESVLKSGQEVLVQVSKDPIGHKGARLTGQVSLPGRYLVYVPEGSMTGISRKLPENERDRLKKILKRVVPDGAGVIIRTAAEGASEADIEADVRRLQAQWEVIEAKAAKGGAPALLQAEPDLVVRVVRDVFNEDFATLIVAGDSEWDTIRDYVESVAPELAPRLSRHAADTDVFAEHRIDEQLLKALDRKVYLPSGGSLVIDRTEAMVVVDVNTGKYVGKGGNLEETVTRNNLEAAEEIARQLRLRDLGGIIVVDFIDMVLESNRDLVVRRLVECLGRDRTKHQVAEVTSLGLVQMTRKRVGAGLLESFSEPCDCCDGRGVKVHPEPVDERGTGGGDRPRARVAKPLPADAPKPGAGIGRAAAAVTESDAGPDGAAEPQPADEPAPRRRRRGGRGRGAATVAPSDELAAILDEPGPDESGSDDPGSDDPGSDEPSLDEPGPVDPVPDSVLDDVVPDSVLDDPVPDSVLDDVVPELQDADLGADPADQVPADQDSDDPESADQAPVDLTGSPAEPDLTGPAGDALAAALHGGSGGEPFAGGQPAEQPAAAEPAAGQPRRRRRVTSRPAGPPA